MRITDAIKVDHQFRHYRKAQTTLQTLRSRMQWYQKHMPDAITPTHERRLADLVAALQREIASENLVWEINTSLSRRPILTLPTATITAYCFHNLPEPGPAQPSPLEQSMVELMNMRVRTLAAQQHKFLLMCEIAYRAKHNWFMIFNTLTVAPGEYYAVFSKTSKAFKNYIRNVDRAYQNATTPTRPDLPTHFAVTEEGAQNGRLHIHALHFTPRLPTDSQDPNTGKLRPTERTLPCLRRYWKHGRSEPIMVRYSPLDAFGAAGYRWPLDWKTQAPQVIKSPLALANYLSKYITKGYNSCQRSKLLWRVKKSHALGQPLLYELMDHLSTNSLLIMTTADNLRTKLNNQTIPQNLLRLTALRLLRNRLSTTPFNEYTTVTQIAKLSTPRLSPLHYSRASIQTIQESSRASLSSLSTLGLNNEDTFKTAWLELQQASNAINAKYFPRTSGTYGTASSRDHIFT